jgi:hypothetical protein
LLGGRGAGLGDGRRLDRCCCRTIAASLDAIAHGGTGGEQKTDEQGTEACAFHEHSFCKGSATHFLSERHRHDTQELLGRTVVAQMLRDQTTAIPSAGAVGPARWLQKVRACASSLPSIPLPHR